MTEVGTAYVRILPSMTGFSTALQGQMSGAAATSGAVAGKKAGGSFGGGLLAGAARFAAPLAAVFGAVKLFDFGKQSVQQASSLAESVNAVRVTYKDAAKEVFAFGKTSDTALGLSTLDLNNFAVRFSSFAKTVAGSGGSAADTFRDIATRATDFASVMNIDVNEAAVLFQSGLAGETEPLRRFGIDMSAASVQAFAYAKGIAETGSELTEQQKVQARYGLLMKQTARTQGDFAKTSGGLANQQRILGAQFDNLKATLGEALLPAVTAVVSGLNSFVGSVSGAIKGAGGLTSALKGIFGGAGGAGAGIGAGFSSALSTLREAFAQFAPVARDIATKVGAAFQSILPTLRSIFSTIGSIIGTAMQVIAKVISVVLGAIRYVWKNWGTQIMGFVRGAMQFVTGIIRGALALIEGIWKAVLAVLKGDWKGAWDAIKNALRSAGTALIGAFRGLGNAILNIMNGLGSALNRLWGNIWNFAKQAFQNGIAALVGFARALPGRIVAALGNLRSTLLSAGGDLIRGFIDGVLGAIGGAIQAVVEAVGRVIQAAKDRLRIKSPSQVFMDIGERTAEGMAIGIRNGARDVQAAVAGITRAPSPAASPAGYASARDMGGITIVAPTPDIIRELQSQQRHRALRARQAVA